MTRRFSVPDAAHKLGAQAWQVRRLFERGDLPEPDRVGRARAIDESQMPAVEAALRAAGYLQTSPAMAS